MKRLFYLWAVLATVLAITNCQKEELTNGEHGENASLADKYIIHLSTPTKTANNGLSTVWVKGDKVNVFHAVAGTEDYVNDGAFEYSSGDAFSGSLGEPLEKGEAYDWYIAYPYREKMKTPKSMSVSITREQEQSEDGNMGHLCNSLCPLFGKVKGISADQEVKLTMEHLVTVMKIKVTNYEADPCLLETVSFSHHDASNNFTPLCGNYLVDLTAETQEFVQNESSLNADISDWKENDAFTKAQIEDDPSSPYVKLQSPKTLNLNESATVYLVCKPFTIENATFLCIGMNKTEGDISQRICKHVVCRAGAINGVKQGSRLAPPFRSGINFYHGKKNADGTYTIDNDGWWRCDLPEGYDLQGSFNFKDLFTTVNEDCKFELIDAGNQNVTVKTMYDDFKACINETQGSGEWDGHSDLNVQLYFPDDDRSGIFVNSTVGYQVGSWPILYREPHVEAPAPEFDTQSDMYDSYQGLVMAGYQGWHGTPGDGCPHNPAEGWPHYASVAQSPFIFEPGVLRNNIDFWPDVSEYPCTYKAPDGFVLPNGNTARLYSSYDESTVDLHFRWMKEYGIDGVFMQRFVSQIADPNAIPHSDKVLQSAMTASNVHARAISIMYDMVGMNQEIHDQIPGPETILADAAALKAKYNLDDRSKGQRYFLYHNGKPLIGLVSVGQVSAPYTIAQAQAVVDGLQEMGFSIILGVPAFWREPGKGDCVNDKTITNLIKDVDIIMPWLVGAYDYDGTVTGTPNGSFNNYWTQRMEGQKFGSIVLKDGDYIKAEQWGVEYCPLVFPGFSDKNMHPNNQVYKRYGGDFYWQQIYKNLNKGAKMLYVAMFDEIDEGTAIYKCLRQSEVPSNTYSSDYYVIYNNGVYSRSNTAVSVSGTGNWCKKASELGIKFNGIEDNLDSDYYLWLTGQAAKVLKGEATLTPNKPTR